jgi:hypothetical protein
MKTVKSLLLTVLILGLAGIGSIALVTAAVLKADVSGADAHESCQRLQGANVGRVDAQFGEPRRVWEQGSFVCPGGLRCSVSEWKGPVRTYAAGLDSSLIAYFDGGVLSSCDLSGS